jgi:predicted Zn-dependent peptidase
MKKYTLAIITLALAFSASSQTLDRSIRPKPGPAPKIELGKTESFTLPNGLRVFVVENHKVPLISASIELDIKPELQGDMAGFHDIVGELLTAGTKTRSKDALDLAIDNIGATIKADEQSMYGTSLKRSQNMLLELMSDIAMNADFNQTELDKLKKQSLSGLAAAKNDPDAMLDNVTRAVNYGPQHPYGEIATEETINKITLDRCRKYYTTYWRPNIAYMAIVGDVTVAEIKPLIEKYFGRWQKATVPVASYTVPAPGGVTRVAMAPRDAAVQSVFNVTYPIDLEPGQPDVIKARVANSVLGGGSQGRLFLNLREAHGWTYGSYSTIKEDDLIGSFTAYAKCRNAVTDSAVRETLKEMQRMREEPITQEELQNRITYMTGNFAINLENPQAVAQYAINIERYKMPKDYYTNYLRNLAAVTTADVQNVARKYIRPEAANIVVVGNSDEVAKKLEQFGPVSMYDNYGRSMAPSSRKAAPANVSAEDIRRKYVAAVGGEKAIAGIKDIKIVYGAEIQGTKITYTEAKSNGRLKKEVAAGEMVFQKSVYADGKGKMEMQGQSKDLSGEELAESKRDADIQAVLHPEQYGMKRTVVGMEKLNGEDHYVVETVDASGSKGKEYYQVSTGLLIRQADLMKTPQGEMPRIIEFSDYREVPGTGGYKIPYTIRQGTAAQELEFNVQSVDVNKGIPDSEFKF